MERRTFIAVTCATSLIPSSLMAADIPVLSGGYEFSNVVLLELNGLWANMDVGFEGQPLGRIGVFVDDKRLTVRVWDCRDLPEAHRALVEEEVVAIGKTLHKTSLERLQRA